MTVFSPNTLIGIGTLLIALGGFVATHGWNAKANAGIRDGLIRGAAAELLVNQAIVSDQKFAEQDDARLAEFVVFPRLQSVALEGAIASGAFLEKTDRVLLTRMTGLREIIHEFNNRLSITESQMASDVRNIRTLRLRLRDGRTRASVVLKLRLFGDLLVDGYGISRDDFFFVELDEDAV